MTSLNKQQAQRERLQRIEFSVRQRKLSSELQVHNVYEHFRMKWHDVKVNQRRMILLSSDKYFIPLCLRSFIFLTEKCEAISSSLNKVKRKFYEIEFIYSAVSISRAVRMQFNARDRENVGVRMMMSPQNTRLVTQNL